MALRQDPTRLDQKAKASVGFIWPNVGVQSLAGRGGRGRPEWTMLGSKAQTFCSLFHRTKVGDTEG